jgi:hypothetical protein
MVVAYPYRDKAWDHLEVFDMTIFVSDKRGNPFGLVGWCSNFICRRREKMALRVKLLVIER